MRTTPEPTGSFPALLADLAQRRRVPVATYRWQFNRTFTFAHAQQLVPYLHALGMSDCYASPYLKARPGSMHGYDTIDFQTLNPEVGTDAEYAAFVQTLQQHDMGQLLDIVPNHMGVLACHNAWWQDVLTHGRASLYAPFFDIDWQPPRPALRNKVLLPILGDAYGTVLDNQELQLRYEAGFFVLIYYEHHVPIAPCTTIVLLDPCLRDLQRHLGEEHQQTLELQSILTHLEQLPPFTEPDPAQGALRSRETARIQQRLATLYESCQAFQDALGDVLQQVNGVKGMPHSFTRLHTLLEAQPYRLSSWRAASDEINYRRFFDINDLAALRQEESAVFDATHQFILTLLEDGRVTGVRIDHPDGLFDPLAYFRSLQRAYVQRCCRQLLASPQGQVDTAPLDALMTQFEAELYARPQTPQAQPLYVVVEKILEADEQLPQTWPIAGTTGYDFLNQLNGVFIDASHATAFRALYTDFVGMQDKVADLLYTTKKLIMQTSMASELTALGVALDRLSETNRYWRDFTRNTITEALAEVIACFPVYRTYIRLDQEGVKVIDRTIIELAVAQARRRNPAMSPAVFGFLRDVLLLRYPRESTATEQAAQLRFVQMFQQVTGPVMAKGLEDTAFYRHTPLTSLNEVGGSLERFGLSVPDFHQQNRLRLQHWPTSLLATSTHDTKRSEDVRARLNVLSEIPHRWRDCLWQWASLNQPYKTEVDGQLVPAPQEEYLLYQTLLGVYPPAPSDANQADLCTRMQTYMRKALREAKVYSSWIDPHEAYEAAVEHFVQRLLDETQSARFLSHFRDFQQVVANLGVWNSLSQTLLKMTCPGVPDFYQGCELWDFSLVDPDNRRLVDYALRQRLLADLQQADQGTPAQRLEQVRELLHTRHDGRIKLYVIWKSLTFRRTQAQVFLAGDYVPLEVQGSQQQHLCAFARVHHDTVVLVLAPRLLASLLQSEHDWPIGQAVWEETCLVLPDTFGQPAYRQLFTGATVYPARRQGQTVLAVATVLADFPVALLYGVQT